MLVANRGEIAVRVLRTCRRLGIEGVLTVTDADARSLPARLADRVVRVPNYLDVDAVVTAARTCDALHPGYGFLSENPALATACDAAGVRFVGPSAATLAAAGDKLAARGHAVAAGVPVLPGGPADAARAIAAEIGFPLLVKAVGGGGGRGMRRVADSASLDAALDEARAEAGRRSPTDGCTWSAWLMPGGTSRCSCSVTGSGSCTSVTATARCSGATRSSSRRRPRRTWTRACGRTCTPPRSPSASTSATAAPGPSSSWCTRAGSRSWRSTRDCRSNIR